MAKRLPYSGYVRLQLAGLTKREVQEARNGYYSDHGRIENYEAYVAHCKSNGFLYDAPPEGYWEWREKGWEKPALIMTTLISMLTYLMVGIVGSASGRKRN